MIFVVKTGYFTAIYRGWVHKRCQNAQKWAKWQKLSVLLCQNPYSFKGVCLKPGITVFSSKTRYNGGFRLKPGIHSFTKNASFEWLAPKGQHVLTKHQRWLSVNHQRWQSVNHQRWQSVNHHCVRVKDKNPTVSGLKTKTPLLCPGRWPKPPLCPGRWPKPPLCPGKRTKPPTVSG